MLKKKLVSMASHKKSMQYNFCTFCGGKLLGGPFCPSCGTHVSCIHFSRGYCRYGKDCSYAHSHRNVKKPPRRERPIPKKGHTRECHEVGCNMYKKAVLNAQEGQRCKGKIEETGQKCHKVLKSRHFIDKFFSLFD